MFAYESTTPGASFSSSTSPDPRGLLDHERWYGHVMPCQCRNYALLG
jgi:hypothetical protein